MLLSCDKLLLFNNVHLGVFVKLVWFWYCFVFYKTISMYVSCLSAIVSTTRLGLLS